MAEALSPEQQIATLRRELAQRDAIIAAREAELAEVAIFKARLTTALLEIEHMKGKRRGDDTLDFGMSACLRRLEQFS